MLGTIREKTQGIFAFIIVGLLIIPFALWGINSYFEGDRNPPVATVNGEDIKRDEFDAVYQAQVNRYRGQIDPKMLSSGFLRQQVLQSLINQQIYSEHSHDAGYTISNTQLNALIQDQPEFKNGDKFDPERFSAIMRANGIDENTYKQEMRYVKTQDQMLSGYRFSAIVPASEVNDLLALREQQRRFSYVVLEPGVMRAQVKVTDAEIEDYYNTNAQRYQTPDQVMLEYLVLSMDELIAAQKVTDKELREEYERDMAHYTTPAQRSASHILIELPSDADQAEEKAAYEKIRAIEKDVRAGKSFAELAKQYSQDPLTASKGGDLGKVDQNTLPSRDLWAALTKLKQGEISPVIRSQYGLHVLKLTGLTPPKTRSFDSVKKVLEDTLKRRRGEAAYDELRERFETLVYENADSLAPAANDTGLKIRTSGWLERKGGTGVLANPDVVNAAFSAQVRQSKQNSDVIEAGRNTLVAIRMKDDRPAKPKPLAAVRSEVKAALLQQKSQNAARNIGEEILQKARTGESLSKLASARGASLKGPVWLKRAELQEGKASMDASIARAAFAAGVPDSSKPVYGGLAISGGAYAIYQLHEVRAGSAATATPKQREEVTKLLEERRGSGYYRNQLEKLRQQAEVVIRKDQVAPAQQ